MKYYILTRDTNIKSCYLENRNSFEFRIQFYNKELFNLHSSVELSFNKEIRNKYLPIKNVFVLWGLLDSFVVDRDTMEILKNHYSDYLRFIEAEIIDDERYADKNLYILYFNHLINGLNREKSRIKFDENDTFVVEDNAELCPIFKFNNCLTSTFADETFKKFIEENNIEGWIFREAFEK